MPAMTSKTRAPSTTPAILSFFIDASITKMSSLADELCASLELVKMKRH
jgi:hypothetical protein